MVFKVNQGKHALQDYPHLKVIIPVEEATIKVENETTNKRKAQQKIPNQLVLNLFHEGRRFYIVIANCSTDKASIAGKPEDGVRMFYLLDQDLKII